MQKRKIYTWFANKGANFWNWWHCVWVILISTGDPRSSKAPENSFTQVNARKILHIFNQYAKKRLWVAAYAACAAFLYALSLNQLRLGMSHFDTMTDAQQVSQTITKNTHMYQVLVKILQCLLYLLLATRLVLVARLR